MKLIIGVTGSVATIKLSDLLYELQKTLQGSLRARESSGTKCFILDLEVKIVGTRNSLPFIPEDLGPLVITDKDEWEQWRHRDDPILHIEVCPARLLTLFLQLAA